jgi:glycosyltransferase involved in cell wall biosynthesis
MIQDKKINDHKMDLVLEEILQNNFICDDLVSVIIPTYNRFQNLKRAIESVRNQTHKNIEIIVINDASIQVDYYQESLGSDVILINLPINMKTKNQAKAAHGLTRNEGIQVAKGKWIAFLDDDDYWFPDKLKIQLYYLYKYNSRITSSTYMYGIGVYNETKIKSYKKSIALDQTILDEMEDHIYKLLAKRFAYVLMSTVVVERSLLDQVGYFKLIDAEDWDLWNRICNETTCLLIDIMLIYYDNNQHTKHYVYYA